ncbi:MAG: hypothetical protein ABSH31_14430 [Bryobacteraceae bacterium]
MNSNNIASSTKPLWRDWPNIVQICFDNREADIGNFLRRHLGAQAREKLQHILATSAPSSQRQRAEEFLEESRKRFGQAAEGHQPIPDHGYWEAAMVINGDIPIHRLNLDFLRMLDVNNPRYTGWPVWMTTERFSDRSERPYVYENKLYEALLVSLGKGW